MEHQFIIAYADKAILRISGLQIKGLNTLQLESLLTDKLHSVVRVIGVTGKSIELDVYDVDPEYIKRSESNVIEAVSLTEGVSLTELIMMECSDKIIEVDFENIPLKTKLSCAKERWLTY